jgi:transposase
MVVRPGSCSSNQRMFTTTYRNSLTVVPRSPLESLWRASSLAWSVNAIRSHGRDEAAVLAALQLRWSNVQVEGSVHRQKLSTRQVYGRVKFDLLRLRVLRAG